MQVDKEDVAELLRRRGDHDKAAHLKCALPQRVDTDVDAGILHQFEVNVSELAQVLADRDESAAQARSA